MENAELILIVSILALGIFSQWFAWRIQWPSIVIMSVVGLLIGPVLGVVNPDDALGDLYSPLISLAVALILFEASSSLDFREIQGISKSVLRIITLGAFIAWILGSLFAHFLAGLSLEVAFIIGGLFVVTGPTVIIPLLRNAKLKPRPAAVLKWEGIIVDPAGPLLALFAYEVIKVLTKEEFGFDYLLNFFLYALLAAAVGLGVGYLLSKMINLGMIPEYLKSPIVLAMVLLCFAITEIIMNNTGMLAVTVMGLTMSWAKNHVSAIGNIHHFIEAVSVLLTSTVFILLTASLSSETIMQMFTWPIISFVLVMLFVVRPLSIWLPTIGTELTLQERTLIGWIAPRGIVALTVAGYFAKNLLNDGYDDAAILMTLTFALVFITVCAHGFTLGPIAKKLDLSNQNANGVVIVGASSFSIALANYLKKTNVPVLIVDTSRGRLFTAEKLGINTHQGEVLTEHDRYKMDLTAYTTMLAMTIDSPYNLLVVQSFSPAFGYQNTFTLPARPESKVKEQTASPAIQSHLLFDESAIFTELNKKINTNYHIYAIEIEEKSSQLEAYIDKETTPLFIQKKANGRIRFMVHRQKVSLDVGDQLVVLGRKEKE